jgi:hypothetical protein
MSVIYYGPEKHPAGFVGFQVFGGAVLVVDLRGINRVEGNPEKDRLAVWVFGLFDALKPTQRAVHTQAEVWVVVFPLSSMTII